MFRSPFSDAIEQSPVPKTSTGKVTYEQSEAPNVPGRTGGDIREIYRDNTQSGSPSTSGPYKTPFKDSVG